MDLHIAGKTGLVTGASAGIGRAIAKALAAEGVKLAVVARRRQLLESLQAEIGAPLVIIECDLIEEDAAARIAAAALTGLGSVDILVNNAGFGSHGYFHQLNLDTQLEMIQLNITSLTHLTHLLLPQMIEKKWGRILNVASTAAFQPGPMMAVYYATKAYVLLLSEAISNELKGTGVSVTALCPGPTHTQFSKRARVDGMHLFNENLVMSAMDVAKFGHRALLDGKAVVVPGLKTK